MPALPGTAIQAQLTLAEADYYHRSDSNLIWWLLDEAFSHNPRLQ
jgi:hypothetical protein